MTQHIGIVAGSAEGAALCYRTIVSYASELLGTHAHPEVSLHGHSFAEYMEHIERDDWQGVGDLMLGSSAKLAAIGADFLICPDNTFHQVFGYLEPGGVPRQVLLLQDWRGLLMFAGGALTGAVAVGAVMARNAANRPGLYETAGTQ